MRMNRIRRWGWRGLTLLASVLLLALPAAAVDLYVDCAEGNPSGSPFTSITAAINSQNALPPATDYDYILLASDCTENVTITSSRRLWIAPADEPWPWNPPTNKRVRITAANPSQGVLSIQTPENITLVHVSLSGGTTGLTLGANANVTAYGVVAENNSGDGINVAMGGSLELEEGGSLNNAGWGISASSGANLNLSGGADWLQNVPLTISGNGKGGIRWDRSHLGVWMGTTIENNAGWGLVSTGGDAFFGSCCNDQTVVQGNEGGAFLSEASELSIWGATIIRENGDFGVYAEMGSHVTVWANEGTPLAVEGHAKIGVNITANSQAKIFGPSLFRNNGSPGEPASAGVRIDGNSNAVFYPSTDGTFTKGAEVRGNHGPGILVDLNSSVDATAAVVRGNSKEAVRLRDRSVAYLGPDVTIKPNGGGPLTCDLTCLAVTDLVHKSLSCPNVEKPREPRLPWLSPSPIR